MEQLIKNRTSLRTKATNISRSLDEARHEEHTDQDDLAYLIFSGEKLIQEINSNQDELDSLEVYDDSKHLALLTEQLFKANRLLKRLEAKPTTTNNEQRLDERTVILTSEPTVSNISIPKFHGDLMAWAKFSEVFNSFVHSNIRYNDVQKLVILKTHLGGEASQAVEGVPYTTEGYLLARSILHERFDQTDKRREFIIGQIMDIPAVTNDQNLKGLRLLIDKVAASLRSLESLQIPSYSLSSVITPVIKSKLPNAWRLGWVRSARENTGDLPSLLKYLQKEIALREDAASPMRSFAGQSRSQSPRPQPAVAGALRVSTRPSTGSSWTCTACGRYKHGLARCFAYQNMSVPDRWAAVRQAGLCFQCLGPHQYRSCRSHQCHRCGAPHHSSLHDTERTTTHLPNIFHHPVDFDNNACKTAAITPSSKPPHLNSDQRQLTSFPNVQTVSSTSNSHIASPPHYSYHIQTENMRSVKNEDVCKASRHIVPLWKSTKNISALSKISLLRKRDKRPVSSPRATNMRTYRAIQKMSNQERTDHNNKIKQLVNNRIVDIDRTTSGTNFVFLLPYRGTYRKEKLRTVADGSAANDFCHQKPLLTMHLRKAKQVAFRVGRMLEFTFMKASVKKKNMWRTVTRWVHI